MSSKRRHMTQRKRRFPVLIILVLILVVLAAGVITERFVPTKEHADLNKLYGSEEGYASILANHEWVESKARVTLDHAYLSYDTIHNTLNSRFYYDPVEDLLLYTLPDETVQADSETAYDGAPVFFTEGDTVWISLAYVQQYSNISAEYFDNPSRIVLQTEWGEETTATAARNTAVRLKGGIRSPILTSVSEGDSVTVLDQMAHWTKVQTSDGFVGYVTNQSLKDPVTAENPGPYQEPEYTGNPVNHQVCMIWEQVFKNSGEKALKSFLQTDTPVTTVSPTWFSMKDSAGNIDSLADASYVQTAHAAGLEVWPLLEDINNKDSINMSKALQSTANRTNLVNNVMAELEASGADGLNVDLEYVTDESSDGYIQLIRELSLACRQRGLTLSVDDASPSSVNSRYHYAEQGIMADYVVIMGYDEHYSGSDPGSTASLPFVRQGIETMLQCVPADKVIGGIPFYTRLWEDSPSGISSKALGMTDAVAWVADNGLETTWLDEESQNYAKKTDGDTTWQIWLEDADSMDARLVMMKTYSLAGISFWKMGMQDNAIWTTIAKYTDASGSGAGAAETQSASAETATAATETQAVPAETATAAAGTQAVIPETGNGQAASTQSAETQAESASAAAAGTSAAGSESDPLTAGVVVP